VKTVSSPVARNPWFWLLLYLTLFALLPWQPEGPFDARDWSRIDGVSVTMPWWQFLVEPITALGHVITGAPDFRQAAASIAAWVMVVVGVWVYLRRADLSWWRRGVWAGLAALFGVWLLPAYMLLFSHIHFPGWQLETDTKRWLVADLQSHTLGSHDALVRAEDSLQWHLNRGYNVVALTEHDDATGAFYGEKLSTETGGPLIIPGIEVATEHNGFLLAVGLKGTQLPPPRERGESGYSARFIKAIKAQHQGSAIIALAWRLEPEDVESLARAGVDAFEVINVGHPDIPDTVRETMLRLEREGRIRLVSSTDWHGWSGSTRGWTLITPASDGASREQQVDHIMALLRGGQRDQIVPVVAGYQGEVPGWRLLLAPLVELARYGAELSPLRLLGWWLWAILLWLMLRRLRARGYEAGPLIWNGMLLLAGAVLLWQGIDIYRIRPEGDVVLSDVTEELGLMAMQAAVPLLFVALWWGRMSLRRHDG